jgi:hypothetical protein
MREVAAAKPMARNPGRRGGGAIRFLVADEKTRGAIDRPAPEKIQYHPGSGLPPVADAAVFCYRCFRVKRTVADVVEVRSNLGELDQQLRMKRQYIVFRVEPFSDTRLVGDDKDQKPRIVQHLDRCLGALDPAEAAARADISVIVIEHPVTIQECCRKPHHPGRLARGNSRSSTSPQII